MNQTIEKHLQSAPMDANVTGAVHGEGLQTVTGGVGGGSADERGPEQETADRNRWLELFDELPVEKRDLLASVGFLEELLE